DTSQLYSLSLHDALPILIVLLQIYFPSCQAGGVVFQSEGGVFLSDVIPYSTSISLIASAKFSSTKSSVATGTALIVSGLDRLMTPAFKSILIAPSAERISPAFITKSSLKCVSEFISSNLPSILTPSSDRFSLVATSPFLT